MDRRQLVSWLASAAGISVLDGLRPPEMFGLGQILHARAGAEEPLAGGAVLSSRQRTSLEVAAERIIPADDTPGATDARVAAFIEHILADWFDTDERDRFLGGLAELDVRARALRSRDFIDCEEADQIAILTRLDDEVTQLRRTSGGAANDHPFAMLKYMTVWGYCTSEVAMRAYGDYPLPMRYDGCAVLPSPGRESPSPAAV